MEAYLIALFGAALALGGSIVQALVGRLHSISDKRRELLIDAYNDYLRGVAQRVSILSERNARTEEATALMISGKQKICAYGPEKVVFALGVLEETPLSLSEATTQTAMLELIKAMRESTGVESKGLDQSISKVLFSADFV